MKMKRGFIFIFFFLLSFLFLFTSSVNARSGCCSWHGGVCGCGCCDGSPLSSTCAPYYPSCSGGYDYYVPVYIPPPPPRPQVNCPTVSARNDFYPNIDGTFRVFFDWDDVENAQSYSIALYNYAFGDPGPNIDTTVSQWWLDGVQTGKRHVAIKTGINGYWSNICDWTIEVPQWYPPPTPTNEPTPTNIPITDVIQENYESLIPFSFAGILFSLLAYGAWKNKNNTS